jgi:hypothetical protein
LEGSRRRRLWPARWRWRISIIFALVIGVVVSAAWYNREQIAGNLIDDTLAASGLAASYDIEEIGPQRQVIANLVIGDPALPDLTAERVILDLTYAFGAPQVSRIELVRPRLYGRLGEGRLSFGTLDPLLYAESEEPAGLPELNVAIVDGRARIETGYGVIGAKLDGAGRLDDGFAGKLAATAPGLGVEGCTSEGATIYGDVATAGGKVSFNGPVRLRALECEGARVKSADIGTRLTLAADFGSVDGDLDLAAASLSRASETLARLGGTVDFAWRFAGEREGSVGELSLRHDLEGEELATPYADVQRIAASGTLRSRDNLSRSEWTASLSGEGIEARRDALAAIADARAATAETFAGSLLARLERGLAGGLKGGELTGNISVRTQSDSLRLVIPEARLRSGAGETLLALSRVSYATAGEERPERLAGNFLTGGADLPQVNGRVQQVGGGDLVLRMAMAEYRAGEDALAIPRMEARRDPSGRIAFNAMVRAEGAIPGGSMRGLVLPLEGTWSPEGGLAIGRRCTDVRLASLSYYDLALTGSTYSICPVGGAPIASYSDSFRLAARTDDLALTGQLAETPARIAATSATIAYPGAFRIDELDAVIGPADNAVRLTATKLDGEVAESVGGSFEGASAAIDVVPLDLSDLSGAWDFSESELRITQGAFTLTERIDAANGPLPRFEPLRAQGAYLSMSDNVILANAGLRHPRTGRLVTSVDVQHDLGTGTGRADLGVDGLRFDDAFQPDDVSYLAKGVIANAEGAISGDGAVEWTPDTLDSSGMFTTSDFDFAAAFGPVRGVSGTIIFTDLLALTTAPGQVLDIGSVNPGIEALGGRVVYSMTEGTTIRIEDGRWPFMGGELILRPVTLDFGEGEGQSYIFELIALDAATFVSELDFSNIGATGTFDGTIPMHFDADGNGSIRGGLLISRPPGGNVSYVGELTYEDLGTIGNYAFQSLRSLDYNQMSIELNGNLAGEILTQFNIDGVRQGEGASRNFVTRRLSKLPIRFRINVRSENFFLLATIVRGLFDPTIFGNPVDQGLFELEDGRFVPRSPLPPPPPPSPQDNRDEPAIQPPESDNLP